MEGLSWNCRRVINQGRLLLDPSDPLIVLDTNVLSELLNLVPDPVVEIWAIEHIGSDTYITAINEAELRQGVSLKDPGRKRDELRRDIENLLNKTFANRVLPFDSAAAKIYADIVASRRRAKRKVSFADCQIAAIARLHNAAVATRNVEDFLDCGIEIINPWDHPGPGGRSVRSG